MFFLLFIPYFRWVFWLLSAISVTVRQFFSLLSFLGSIYVRRRMFNLDGMVM